MPNTYTSKLNLPLIGSGDTNWKAAGDACTNMIDTIGDLMSFTVNYSGQAILNEVFGQRKFNQAVTITKIDISTRDMPVGDNITMDCTLDGTEQSKIATVTAGGATFQTTDITDFDVTNAQVFGLKIKNVGTTNIGGEMCITVHYQPKAIATI